MQQVYLSLKPESHWILNIDVVIIAIYGSVEFEFVVENNVAVPSLATPALLYLIYSSKNLNTSLKICPSMAHILSVTISLLTLKL